MPTQARARLFLFFSLSFFVFSLAACLSPAGAGLPSARPDYTPTVDLSDLATLPLVIDLTPTPLPTDTPEPVATAIVSPTPEATKTLTPMESFDEYMEQAGITSKEYKKKEGKVYKAGTELVIFDPAIGEWNYDFAYYIASKTCMSTEYKFNGNFSLGLDGKNMDYSSDYGKKWVKYVYQIADGSGIGSQTEFDIFPTKKNDGKECQFIRNNSKLAYQNMNGGFHAFPIIGGTKQINYLQGRWKPAK